MNIFKKVLSIIVILQLLAVLVIVTNLSLNKINTITDVTLTPIVKDKSMIKRVVSSFNLKQYRENRYRELSWIVNHSNILLTKNIEIKAKKFLGRPYVWGATGPNCFDCSGFTQKVYKSIGINLPRISRSQAKVGRLVRFNELQKGDMVFFDTSRANRGRVNHVGIYLEDGKFIHASSGKRKVVITSFNKKIFYKRHFLWGRRVINSGTNYSFN